MRLFEISGQPEVKLDIDNNVYIVYDETGKEFSRHTFQHVWDSSPAKRAAESDVRDLKIKLRSARAEQSVKAIEAKPLTKFEEEYLEIQAKWQRYYNILFPRDKSSSSLDDETKQIYTDQMDKWMSRLEQLNQVVRKSVIDRTYKPSA
jgi:hypothetical protein